MGRGRAKAKQTKVARDLKYRTHETDFGALASELHKESGESPDEVDPEVLEKWADYTGPSRDCPLAPEQDRRVTGGFVLPASCRMPGQPGVPATVVAA